ncbi:ABC transporter substrate-binding protein [Sinorhizobium medicae]|uniref:ABC transporter substrate-binding protein n=1 Tax=Sinorhizobium medicae TaxID=110321 RepID=A0A6G1WUG2_9HYPH|nr:ABC transporter substrate-binding protein [Sinorhizobium medicae]MDX0438781.1 transporter substrate-binding domain-containing protein [Sinorhizobium medicae]MDX0457193.1 transporter substrate-binding domain-containing protein [Sinorhizobium medicae]MDX0500266.1 transporter substrate-binding domain-containing protein [Sinorhizobium medicae]MDX0506016.1 transporter substrate-binding domain-containing protein [Sinorhizobium medicae]MDX0549265.1 transporter substrate-binding domain-containing p
MFKSILAGCVLSAVLAMPALAEVIPALHDALPQEYKENGVKAAVFNDWAPDEFQDADGQLKGWSVDIAKEMEERLGVPFTFEGTSFDAIIPGLQSKRFDAGFSSFGTTAERLKTLDFVSQRKIGTSFAYPADSKLDIKTAADACGLTVAVLNGSWDLGLLEKLNDNECKDNPVTMQTHGTQAQAELAVRSQRAQATVAGSVKLAYMAKQTGDLKVSELVLSPVNSCIGVRKGDPLGQVMTDAIQSMIDDGTYEKIMAKWGLNDSGMLTQALLITEENPADL